MENTERLPVEMYGAEVKSNDVRHLVMSDDYCKAELFAQHMCRELKEGKERPELMEGWESFTPTHDSRLYIAMQDKSKISDTVRIMTARLIETKE